MRFVTIFVWSAALTSLAAPDRADAATVAFTSDAAFLASTTFVKTFGAQSRWGNGATNGDWEAGIVDGASSPYAGAQQQVAWGALPGYGGAPNHSLTFAYDAVRNALDYVLRDIGGNVFSATAAAPGAGTINTLAVRARADGGDVASLAALRIEFASGGFFDLGALVGDADGEYLMLVDDRLAGGFTLAGDATLRDGRGSLPMYEFKLGATPVPVPAAGWLLLSGIAGLTALRRRRPCVSRAAP